MSDRKPEIRTPSLRTLSFVLRNKELWPAGFVWSFRSCQTCAMGMANKMWRDRVPSATTEAMATAFDMPGFVASMMFTSGSGDVGKDVSPEMVADRIDYYLDHGASSAASAAGSCSPTPSNGSRSAR